MKNNFLFILLGSLAIILLGGLIGFSGLTKVQETEALIDSTFASSQLNIFNGYTSWPSSNKLDSSNTIAKTLQTINPSTSGIKSSQTDINGDGLVDILYHDTGNNAFYGAVLLNLGSLDFDLTYKCVYDNDTYYGDCAGQ